MNQLPQLTIVMPFFNQKELVAKMIDSILANDFCDWELLAIDDGSTADAQKWLHLNYTDSRIHFLNRTISPKGAQVCRNMGMELARGKYIVFFDSDDWITPSCLATRIKELSQRPELDFIVFPSGIFQDDKFMTNAPNYIYGYPVYADDVKAFASRTPPFIVWNNIYRTAALRENKLSWDVSLQSFQDADFNLHAILAGLKYDYAHVAPDYGYRIGGNTGSISKKIITEEHMKSHLHAINNFYSSLQHTYGNHYNGALYKGVLYIYNKVMSDKIDYSFASNIAHTINRYSWFYGHLFRLQTRLSFLMEKVLPQKMARQLPMLCYLIGREHNIRKVANKIKKLQRL